MFKCLFKGHEMTENKDITIEGLKTWRCKRCSFGMMSSVDENYEGVTMIRGGRKKK